MNIYLAGRYARREELARYAAQLEAAGDTITSRWLKGNHQVTDDGLSAEGTPEERERFAVEESLEATDSRKRLQRIYYLVLAVDVRRGCVLTTVRIPGERREVWAMDRLLTVGQSVPYATICDHGSFQWTLAD